jgi:large subunit ribosomal protein L13
MCAKIAAVLRGKTKAYYTPHVDTGDYVIVINCEKVVLTGNKLDQKMYDHFTGYPGGLKEEVARNLIARRPEVVVERAVKACCQRTGWAARCTKNYLCMLAPTIRILHSNQKN